jgi:O-antigen ligase
LIRFLASKGQRKDGIGVRSLSDEEIAAIEHGIANVSYMRDPALVRRFKETVWEIADYRNGGDANGHSLTQRLEFWKNAVFLIRHHPVVGVGTGDMPASFRRAYEETDSRLLTANRLRSHNQYLAIGVAFGLAGLLYFLVVLISIFIHPNRRHDVMLNGYFIILTLSMVTEDTLETQPGATFFALFLCLLLFSKERNPSAIR